MRTRRQANGEANGQPDSFETLTHGWLENASDETKTERELEAETERDREIRREREGGRERERERETKPETKREREKIWAGRGQRQRCGKITFAIRSAMCDFGKSPISEDEASTMMSWSYKQKNVSRGVP